MKYIQRQVKQNFDWGGFIKRFILLTQLNIKFELSSG